MKLFTSLMPLIPQPYKNIIKFFIKVLDNVDSKEELTRIGKKFEEITSDEKILLNSVGNFDLNGNIDEFKYEYYFDKNKNKVKATINLDNIPFYFDLINFKSRFKIYLLICD